MYDKIHYKKKKRTKKKNTLENMLRFKWNNTYERTIHLNRVCNILYLIGLPLAYNRKPYITLPPQPGQKTSLWKGLSSHPQCYLSFSTSWQNLKVEVNLDILLISLEHHPISQPKIQLSAKLPRSTIEPYKNI